MKNPYKDNTYLKSVSTLCLALIVLSVVSIIIIGILAVSSSLGAYVTPYIVPMVLSYVLPFSVVAILWLLLRKGKPTGIGILYLLNALLCLGSFLFGGFKLTDLLQGVAALFLSIMLLRWISYQGALSIWWVPFTALLASDALTIASLLPYAGMLSFASDYMAILVFGLIYLFVVGIIQLYIYYGLGRWWQAVSVFESNNAENGESLPFIQNDNTTQVGKNLQAGQSAAIGKGKIFDTPFNLSPVRDALSQWKESGLNALNKTIKQEEIIDKPKLMHPADRVREARALFDEEILTAKEYEKAKEKILNSYEPSNYIR